MAKSATIQARIEPALKAEVDAILAALGVNASTAIALYYSQIVRQRGIPIELKVPNEETVAAMRELKDPDFIRTARRYKSAGELVADIDGE